MPNEGIWPRPVPISDQPVKSLIQLVLRNLSQHTGRNAPFAIDDGQRVATIPFVVPARVLSPPQNAAYGGFVAAGALMLLTIVVALRGRGGAAGAAGQAARPIGADPVLPRRRFGG